MNDAGISLTSPPIFSNANGTIDNTLPSGKTEYHAPSKGTNSFSHDGGFSANPIDPRSMFSATRKV